MAGRDLSRGCQPVPGCLCDCAIWRKQSELSQAGRGPGRENVGGGRRKSCGVGSAARLFLLARPSLLRDIERAMRFSGRAPQQRGVFRVVEKSHDPQTLLGLLHRPPLGEPSPPSSTPRSDHDDRPFATAQPAQSARGAWVAGAAAAQQRLEWTTADGGKKPRGGRRTGLEGERFVRRAGRGGPMAAAGHARASGSE